MWISTSPFLTQDLKGLRDSGPLDCQVNADNLGNSGTKTELEQDSGSYGLPLGLSW